MRKIFVIYDEKAKYYTNPMIAQTRGEFFRMIASQSQTDNSTIFKFPEDFVIYEIGEYDEQIGHIVSYDVNEKLGKVSEFIVQTSVAA